MENPKPRRRFHPVYLCLAVPYVAMLWVPFFNRATPEILGIPFFYWYQMAWVFIGAAMIVPVYLYEQHRNGDAQ